jgi:hypothetical protein
MPTATGIAESQTTLPRKLAPKGSTYTSGNKLRQPSSTAAA